MHVRSATPADAASLLAIYAPYVTNTAITFEYEVPSVEEFSGRIAHTLERYPYLVAVSDAGDELGADEDVRTSTADGVPTAGGASSLFDKGPMHFDAELESDGWEAEPLCANPKGGDNRTKLIGHEHDQGNQRLNPFIAEPEWHNDKSQLSNAESEHEVILGYAYASPFKERAAYDWAVETSIYVAADARHRGIGGKLHAALKNALAEKGIQNMCACITVLPEGRASDPYVSNNSMEFHAHLGYSLVGRFHQVGYKFDRWYDMVWMELMIGDHDIPAPRIS